MSAGQSPSSLETKPAPARAGAARFSRAVSLWGLVLGAALVASAPGVEPAVASAPDHRDGAPPGYTGAFGEGNCTGCHFDFEVNHPPGSVAIEGAPDRYTPGTIYLITVTLTRPAMKIGGFQLTTRFEEGGAQAGALVIRPEDAEHLKIATDRGIQYATHRRTGTSLASPDTARWTVSWTAPSSGGTVQINAAANAADGNDSQFGDYIFLTSSKSSPDAASAPRHQP